MSSNASYSLRRIVAVAAAAAGVFFLLMPFLTAVAAPANPEEREALERQLSELEAQIAADEANVSRLKLEGKTLQSEIDRLNSKIAQANLKIKALNLQLVTLDREIGVKEGEIKVAEDKLGMNRGALTRTLQKVYESGDTNLMEMLLRHGKLSDFFGNLNNLADLQDSLVVTIDRIREIREDLVEKRETLALKRSDAVALKAYQDAQRLAIQSTKVETATLLTATKGNEQKYQKLVAEKRKTAAQIRSQIFQLLGGGELSFETAYEFAKVAEGATDVRAALILAVLDRESKLGVNVGRCGYEKAMHPTRDIPVFLSIMAKLKLDPKVMLVSCANRDGAYGGAMGPAQSLPSTWKIYEDRIAAATGNNPPSPWNNADAFMLTALYLKDAGAARASITNERIAAAKYYAGSRWRSHLWGYGDRVVDRAEEFQKDIDILNS